MLSVVTSPIMLSVVTSPIMLSVVMLSVVMLNVIMLSVVAPFVELIIRLLGGCLPSSQTVGSLLRTPWQVVIQENDQNIAPIIDLMNS